MPRGRSYSRSRSPAYKRDSRSRSRRSYSSYSRRSDSSYSSRSYSRSRSPEINYKRLVLKNNSPHLTSAHIKEIFGKYGSIKAVEMPTRSIKYITIEFQGTKEAEKALAGLDNGWIDGLQVQVSYARPELGGRQRSRSRSVERGRKRSVSPKRRY